VKDLLIQEFEKNLASSIDVGNNLWIGSEKFSIGEILKQRESAYDREFHRWIEDYKQKIRSEFARIMHINQDEDNTKRFAKLLIASKEKRVVPFVGAGLSTPSKLPGWTNFLAEVWAKLDKPLKDFEALVNAGEYEKLASEAFSALGNVQAEERMEVFSIGDDAAIEGAVLILPYLFQGAVITTNFDNVAEISYRSADLAFTRIILGRHSKGKSSVFSSGEHAIFKIHGSYDDMGSRVLTEAEYNSAYSDNDYLTMLESAFTSSTLLFTGCSLRNDRYLKYYADTVDRKGLTNRHYALLRIEPEHNALRRKWITAREEQLAKCNILPIWFEDYRKDIDVILTNLMIEMGLLDDL
jgi:hypothetical protein